VRFGRFSLIAAGAATAVLVAGCGTEHASSGPVKPQPPNLTAAVSRTQAETARIATTISTQTQGMTVSFAETGLFDFAHDRGTITMQSPLGMTELFLPPTVYIKVPAGADDGGSDGLPKGKTWVALPTALAGGSALDGGLLGGLDGGGSPASLLASLTAASSGVTRLGPSTIRGVRVTGFALTINPAKESASMPAADRSAAEAFLKSAGVTKIPVDVWVDAKNLVRREKVTMALPNSMGASAGSSMTMTTDFYDFGVPVQVSAPPAAEVAKEPSSLGMSGSGVAVGSGSSSGSGSGAAVPPPAEAGTLTQAQTAAAEQAVSAFWTAVASNNTAAVAATVLPSQRTCVQSNLGADSGAPKITVSSLHITSARSAGTADATVFFTVKAQASFGGQSLPVLSGGPTTSQWLATAELGGHWYVDLNDSTALAFGGGCS
jgi:hypothetical protein